MPFMIPLLFRFFLPINKTHIYCNKREHTAFVF